MPLNLGGGVFGIEAAAYALLLKLLRQLKDVAIDPDVILRDADLLLRAAKLDVVSRQLGEARDQRIAPAILRHVDLGVRGFDLPAHMAPEIKLPRHVGADGIFVDRRDRDAARAAGPEQRRQQAHDAVVAVEFALVFGVAIDRRHLGRSRDAALEAAFGDADRSRPHVEIGLGDAAFEIGQDGVAEDPPPVRIGRRRQMRVRDEPAVESLVVRQMGVRLDEVGPDRAAAKHHQHRGEHAAAATELRHQCPPTGPHAAGLRRQQEA